MGGRTRRFEASSLVNSHIYEHRTTLHEAQHVAGDELGCLVSGHKNRADDDVGHGNLPANVVVRRVERVHIGRQFKVQLAQTRQTYVGNRDLGAHSGGHSCGGFSHGSATKHKHIGRLYARNSAEKLAISAFRRLQIVGSIECSHAAGNLTHGD